MSDSTAVEVHRPVAVAAPILSDDEINRLWRIGMALARSRMFKDVTQAEQAFAKILLGRDLGLTPMQSLMTLDVVKGNLQMRAVLMANFVRKSDFYDYKVREHDAEHCKIEFFKLSKRTGQWDGELWSEYTIEDAKKQGIYKKDGAWVTVPRNMVYARAMSNGVRWYCPEVLGGIPAYTEGDVFDAKDEPDQIAAETGEAIDSTVALDPTVEAVILRATALRHDGFADRAAAEMATIGQPDDVVSGWVTRATAELDAMGAVADDEPEVGIPEDATPDEIRAQARVLRSRASNPEELARADALDAEAQRVEDGRLT